MNLSNSYQEPAIEQGLAPLPAINAHFFAETPAGEALYQQAAATRHLRRAHVEIFPGGIAGAVAAYAQTPTPELLVVESAAQPDQLFQQLAALAEVVVKGTRVVVLGHVNDLFLYRRMLAEGVHDYMALPLPVEQFVASLSQLFQGEAGAQVGRVVSFMGAKGGVGSSVIAHNVAWLLANERKINTAVTDLDLAFGTAGIDFNVVAAQTVADALSGSERLDEAMIDRLLHKCSEHLMLLAAPGTLEEVVPIQEQGLNTMLDLLRQIVPLTVLDLPSDWDTWMRAAIIQSEKIVITSTLDLAALRNVKVLADSIRKLRPNEQPPLLVLNQVGMGKRPEVPVEKFTQTVGLTDCVVVPFDEVSFGTAAMEGRMLLEEAPSSEAAAAIRRVAAWVADLHEEAQPAHSGSALQQLISPLVEKLRAISQKK